MVAISAKQMDDVIPVPKCIPAKTEERFFLPNVCDSDRQKFRNNRQAMRKPTRFRPRVKTYRSGANIPHMLICGYIGTCSIYVARPQERNIVTIAVMIVAAGRICTKLSIFWMFDQLAQLARGIRSRPGVVP